MAKVQKISKNITPFGSVFFANNELKQSELCKLIDNHSERLDIAYHVVSESEAYVVVKHIFVPFGHT